MTKANLLEKPPYKKCKLCGSLTDRKSDSDVPVCDIHSRIPEKRYAKRPLYETHDLYDALLGAAEVAENDNYHTAAQFLRDLAEECEPTMNVITKYAEKYHSMREGPVIMGPAS